MKKIKLYFLRFENFSKTKDAYVSVFDCRCEITIFYFCAKFIYFGVYGSLELFYFFFISNIMKNKYTTFFLGCILIYPTIGFSTKTVTCVFRDSQNVYREFKLKRTGENGKTFMEAEKKNSPFWKVMSDDKNKLILFREMLRPSNIKQGSVHSIFFY